MGRKKVRGTKLRSNGKPVGTAHVNKWEKFSRAEDRAAALDAQDKRQARARQAPPAQKYCSLVMGRFQRGSDCAYHSTVQSRICMHSRNSYEACRI